MTTIESVPAGTVSNGQALILFVPAIANIFAPTVAELTAVGVKRLTYGLTGDGYKHSVTIGKIRINRFTLPQEIQSMGTIVDDLTLTAPYTNTPSDTVRLALPKDQTGFIVERFAVANSVDIAAAQLVDVIPIKAGLATKDQPVKDQELTRTQDLYVTSSVARDVTVAA
ncbi:phage tail tube protein [Subtercola sp. YIM 133946]|uniref:phage tail tube protein n=1 Tax=Subtercola sp. YIM 133946 TaxID=3118909 RepID=UPI002F950C3B